MCIIWLGNLDNVINVSSQWKFYHIKENISPLGGLLKYMFRKGQMHF